MRFLAPSFRNIPGSSLILVISTLIGATAHANTFTDTHAGLTGVLGGVVTWCDYDNDGDLDILITGEDTPFSVTTKIYRNDGNETFTDINANVVGVDIASVAWGDYDNDGDPDILICGQVAPLAIITAIYRNDGNDTFTDINAALPAMAACSVAWGDYDNDGDLDIVMSGSAASEDITRVYRNDGGGIFADIQANLQGVWFTAVTWGDYDNDGDLDILLTGEVIPDQNISIIYRNDGGDVFTDIHAGLFGAGHGSVAWGDYDSDGDLDILLNGVYGLYHEYTVSRIYRNDGGEVFTDINAGLVDVSGPSVWGDYDNDGDFDILLTGWKNMAGEHTIVYRNDGNGVFVDINDSLAILEDPSAAWGDYDDDGDLDFLLAGRDYYTGPTTKLYRNDGGFAANEPPSSPTGLNGSIYVDSTVLSWHYATDSETQSPGLTYNLRIGTSPGGADIVSPMANGDGYRHIAAIGNTNHDTTWTIKNLPEGMYYWSVQAVDNAFAGSAFAVEDSFSTTATGIGDVTPRQYVLFQNYPNPFNPTTTIEYVLPYTSNVRLAIYDVSGERIALLVDAPQPAGRYEVPWNGTDQAGTPLASGVYFCRLDAGRFVQTRKVILIK